MKWWIKAPECMDNNQFSTFLFHTNSVLFASASHLIWSDFLPSMETQILAIPFFGDCNDPLSLATEQGCMRKYPIGLSDSTYMSLALYTAIFWILQTYIPTHEKIIPHTTYNVRIYTASFEAGLQVEKRLSLHRDSESWIDHITILRPSASGWWYVLRPWIQWASSHHFSSLTVTWVSAWNSRFYDCV